MQRTARAALAATIGVLGICVGSFAQSADQPASMTPVDAPLLDSRPPSDSEVIAGLREYPTEIVRALMKVGQQPGMIERLANDQNLLSNPSQISPAPSSDVLSAIEILARVPDIVAVAAAHPDSLQAAVRQYQSSSVQLESQASSLRVAYRAARLDGLVGWQQAMKDPTVAQQYRDLVTRFCEEQRKEFPNFPVVTVLDARYYEACPPNEMLIPFLDENPPPAELDAVLVRWFSEYFADSLDVKALQEVNPNSLPQVPSNLLAAQAPQARASMWQRDATTSGVGLVPVIFQPEADQPMDARIAAAIMEHDRLWSPVWTSDSVSDQEQAPVVQWDTAGPQVATAQPLNPARSPDAPPVYPMQPLNQAGSVVVPQTVPQQTDEIVVHKGVYGDTGSQVIINQQPIANVPQPELPYAGYYGANINYEYEVDDDGEVEIEYDVEYPNYYGSVAYDYYTPVFSAWSWGGWGWPTYGWYTPSYYYYPSYYSTWGPWWGYYGPRYYSANFWFGSGWRFGWGHWGGGWGRPYYGFGRYYRGWWSPRYGIYGYGRHWGRDWGWRGLVSGRSYASRYFRDGVRYRGGGFRTRSSILRGDGFASRGLRDGFRSRDGRSNVSRYFGRDGRLSGRSDGLRSGTRGLRDSRGLGSVRDAGRGLRTRDALGGSRNLANTRDGRGFRDRINQARTQRGVDRGTRSNVTRGDAVTRGIRSGTTGDRQIRRGDANVTRGGDSRILNRGSAGQDASRIQRGTRATNQPGTRGLRSGSGQTVRTPRANVSPGGTRGLGGRDATRSGSPSRDNIMRSNRTQSGINRGSSGTQMRRGGSAAPQIRRGGSGDGARINRPGTSGRPRVDAGGAPSGVRVMRGTDANRRSVAGQTYAAPRSNANMRSVNPGSRSTPRVNTAPRSSGVRSAPRMNTAPRSSGFRSAPRSGSRQGFRSAPSSGGGFRSAPARSGGFRNAPARSGGGFRSAPSRGGGSRSFSGSRGGSGRSFGGFGGSRGGSRGSRGR